MKIVKRVTEKGIGYFWQDVSGFENIKIVDCNFLYRIIFFEYKDKKHKLRLYEGKYGSNFSFHNTTYYVTEVQYDFKMDQ